jgi:hypothetical protein
MSNEVKPFCMVLYSNHAWGYQADCTIVDTLGMKYRMHTNILTKQENVFDLRKISDKPVEVWWPEFKEYADANKLGQPLDSNASDELKTLASKIRKKPTFDHFDSGMRDGGTIECVLFVDNEQWTIEYHGDVATKNIYPEINDFVSMVYKTLKIEILDDFYDQHTILNCKQNHPLVIVSQECLLHKLRHACVCGMCPQCPQHGGYTCNKCGSHETTVESYRCRLCDYDLCPTCAKKEIDMKNKLVI